METSDRITIFTSMLLVALIGVDCAQSQARSSRSNVAFGVMPTTGQKPVGTYRNPPGQAALRSRHFSSKSNQRNSIQYPGSRQSAFRRDTTVETPVKTVATLPDPPPIRPAAPAFLVSPKVDSDPSPPPAGETAPALPAQPIRAVESAPNPNSSVVGMYMAPEIPIFESNIIRSYYVELPFNKTVSIIFDSPVRSVDLGSRDILADKASDVENVLKVKASKMGFNETNFSVITADGKFHSFVANYNEQTSVLALNLAATVAKTGDQLSMNARRKYVNNQDEADGFIQFENVRATQSDVVYTCSEIMKKRRSVRHLGVESNAMEATVRGVYVKDNVIYYKIGIKNKSNIHYDIDQLRFFVIDNAVAKRTSQQEIEMKPFYVFNENIRTIQGKTEVERVLAFQKFTIPDNKRVQVMMGELNGGRNVSFMLSNDDIIQASKL